MGFLDVPKIKLKGDIPVKVSMKNEKLARGLLEAELLSIGFPKNKISDRVNEAWPGLLPKAELVNLCISNIINTELTGEATKKTIEKWEK